MLSDDRLIERGRRRAGWGLIAIVLIAVAFAVGYTFLRVTDDWIAKKRPATLIYEPHPLHRHVLLPNQQYRDSTGAHFTIGPHRMRGDEPAMPKPEGVFRIYAIGGSSVFDHRAVPSWPERLGPLLSGDERRAESFNGGVPGYSSRETLSFYRDRIARYRPNLVILYVGWNDVKYLTKLADDADVDRYFEWRREFETQYLFLTEPRPLRNWYALSRMLEERDADTMVREAKIDEPKRRMLMAIDEPTRDWSTTAGIGFFRRNVEDLIDRVHRDGGRPVLLVENTLASKEMPLELRFSRIRYEWVEMGHGDLLAANEAIAATLKEIGQREKVPVIDLRDRISGREEYFTDHVHLTQAGSEALAEALAEALRPFW